MKIQTSVFLSEFAEQLHGFSFTEDQRGEESRAQNQKAVDVVSTIFTVEFGSDLQCVQGFSTPPWLPLHIDYIWLQLHHLLLQFTHLGLDNQKRVLVFLKHMLILLHTHVHSTVPDHSSRQFAPSPSTHSGVSLMLKNSKLSKRNVLVRQTIQLNQYERDKCKFPAIYHHIFET